MQTEPRFQLVAGSPRADKRSAMARELRATLSRRPRSIPPKYFYDDVGCRLFDAICDLPEYYLTRAERELLLAHSDRIVQQAQAESLIEIGSGMARKTGSLLRSMRGRGIAPTYVPFDIASEAIERSVSALLAECPNLRVCGVVGDFIHDCARLAMVARSVPGPRLFAFLGSTIGNLDDEQAAALLREVARLMIDRDRFLLGVDLVKAPDVLNAAYNDAQGVTARFNKNVLHVLARELGGEISDRFFEHIAAYDEARERIEMHLVSTREQVITLPRADLRLALSKGELILTEISRKFTQASAERMLAAGGLLLTEWITDGQFALCVARAAASS
ncbi:MAG TPA: L-histidine N(alpha)-methyltransferase [Polyangiaceae bacterium]|nr:L-histidine N(alpha)-methyltransferase [Polyangiaceae bacterium]